MQFRDQKKNLGFAGSTTYDDAINRGATPERALAMGQAVDQQRVAQMAQELAGGGGINFAGVQAPEESASVFKGGDYMVADSGQTRSDANVDGYIQGGYVKVEFGATQGNAEVGQINATQAALDDLWGDGVVLGNGIATSGSDYELESIFNFTDALYVPGPVPISRLDVGPLSLTVNGTLNALNSVANSGLNLLGMITEPIDRFQGELITFEANFGPGGRALAGATALLGATSRAIRGAEAVNAVALRSEAAANIRDARSILREAGLSAAQRNEIIRSFDLETFRVERVASSRTEYRLFDDFSARLEGRYSSGDLFLNQTDRIRNFALMNNSATRIGQVNIPVGSVVFTGRAAPQPTYSPGLTGGANQTFLTGPLSNYRYTEIMMPSTGN